MSRPDSDEKFYFEYNTTRKGSILTICYLLWVKQCNPGIMMDHACVCGPGCVLGIATGYGLDGPGIESWWGRDFSAPVQTGPGAHPASCTMGTGLSRG